MKKLTIIILLLIIFLTPFLWADDHMPLPAGITINKAQLLFQAGKIPEAVNELETLLCKRNGADPKTIEKKGYDHYYIHFLLGNYYLTLFHETDAAKRPAGSSSDHLKNAAMAYELSVKKNPSFSAGWLNLAACHYENQAFKPAAAAFEKGYQTAETAKPIHLYYAAVCYFQADKAKQALSVFERLLKLHRDQVSLEWKETLVNILFSLDLYKRSLVFLEELANQPDRKKQKQWQEVLLHQYLSLEMTRKALSYADYLTRTDPLEPKWWKILCHIHLDAGRIKQALFTLIIYGYITPFNRQECMLAADLYMSMDIPGQAADFYEQVLADSKDRPDDVLKNPGKKWLMLGYCAMNISQYDRARQAFEQAGKYQKQKKQARKAIARIQAIKQLEAPLRELRP